MLALSFVADIVTPESPLTFWQYGTHAYSSESQSAQEAFE